MSSVSVAFWAASAEEMQRGYTFCATTEVYKCLVCGEEFIEGVIYAQDTILHAAGRAVRWHIDHKHGSMFDYLLNMNRQYTGLTELQSNLLVAQQSGLTDKEIAGKLEIGSTSTVRNHRFRLREREKQAKVFSAIMGLLTDSKKDGEKLMDVPRTMRFMDDRFATTEEERKQIIANNFSDAGETQLIRIPRREKRKVVVLQHIISKFDTGVRYSEKEINDVLRKINPDFVTLRRLLVDYGFLDRERDGSSYWVKI